jgi:hypothetical protein
MIFNHEEARTGLWNFVSAHFSMIDRVEGSTYTDEPLAFLLEDASIKESISPYYMARIVDFPAFVADYPFKADGAGVALLHDGPDHGVQPGLVPAEDIKGRQGDGCKDLRAVRRQHQHPDHDDHADGL